MKLVLLLSVLIGATSGSRLLSDSNAAEGVVKTYSDTSCSTETGVDTLTVTSDDALAAMGEECFAPHGECTPISTACESTIAATGATWWNSDVKAVVVYYSDLGGDPCNGTGAFQCQHGLHYALVGTGVALLFSVLLWLSNAFAPKTGPIPGCPSPLPEKYHLFKCKPKTPAAPAPAAV